jgi:SH3-like domain-containing protein
MSGLRIAIIACAAVGLGLTLAGCGEREGRDASTPSGFAVPRYVTLRYDTVNARSGPSEDHRTLWVYHAKGLPVQIIAETEQWRRICDPEGAVSWVHMRLVDGRRNLMRTGGGSIFVRKSPNPASGAVAELKPRTPAAYETCEKGWCKVKLGKVTGWVPAAEVWGADPAAQCRARARTPAPG